MESCGGSGDGKEKIPWTTSTMIENRGKWNLEADIEVLRHLKHVSDNIFAKIESTSKALDSLEADLAETCVGVHLVSNRFLALADSQFVENRVYDDEEVPNESEKIVRDSVNKTKEEEETERFTKRKSAIANGLEILRTNFVPVQIPNIDSDDDDDDVDDDGTPIGIVYKPINPFDNRPLPHLIGSKEFMTDPYVGLKEILSDGEYDDDDDDEDENEGGEDEESSEKSSGSKAFSAREDSEPESDRANVEIAVESELKRDSGDFSGKGLSFAEHLTARLEGMKFEGKLDASSDDSLPPAAPIKIPTTIPYDNIERAYDTKADRFYDNGFDDRYDDYDDSIFGRNSKEQAQDDFEEDDLFLPNDDRNIESTSWSRSSQPVSSIKQNLLKDLEKKLKKDSVSTVSNTSAENDSSAFVQNNKNMNPSTKNRSDDLFSDNGNEDSDSIFAVPKVGEPIKKKTSSNANEEGSSQSNSKIVDDKPSSIDRSQAKKKPDVSNTLKSGNNIIDEDIEDDSLFATGLQKSFSRNSSTKLSDSFHDDTLSIRSNKSGLFDEDTMPSQSSTKAIDDLFKDIDDENDDDNDLFSSYFTKSKTKKTVPSSTSSTKPKTVVDDLFGDFKDDLFANVKQTSKSTSNKMNTRTRVPNLFSDSDSDSEFVSSSNANKEKVKSSIPPVFSSDLPKQQLPSEKLFNYSDDGHDIFSDSSSKKSGTSDDFKTGKNEKLGHSRDIFVAPENDHSKSSQEEDLFKTVGARNNSKQGNSNDLFDTPEDNLIKSSDERDLFKTVGAGKNSKLGDSSDIFDTPENKHIESSKEKELFKTVGAGKNSKQGHSSDLFDTPENKHIESPDEKDLFKTVGSINSQQKTVPPNTNTLPSSKKAISLFDDMDSGEDDGLFGITVSSKKSNKERDLDEDLFSGSSPSKLKYKQDAQNSSSNMDKSTVLKVDQNIASKEKIGTQTIKKPSSEANVDIPSGVSTSKKTVIDESDDLFSSNTNSNLKVETKIPDQDGSGSINRTAKVETSESLFEDTFQTSNVQSIERKTSNSNAPKTVQPPADPLFGDIDDNATDIFSSIGKPGFKSSKNNYEKTATSVPFSDATDRKDDFNMLSDNDDGLFNNASGSSSAPKSSLGENSKSLSKPIEKSSTVEDSNIDQSDFLDVQISTKEKSNEITTKSVPEKVTDAIQSNFVDIVSKVEPILPKALSESSAKSDPLSDLETTPSMSVKPHPPSKPVKPDLSKNNAKPTPPKTLNLPAPITWNESSEGDHTADAIDGGIMSSESKVESPKKITPGKLNIQKTLNIDPRALLPGAQPKFKKSSNESTSTVQSVKSDSQKPSSESTVIVHGIKSDSQSEDSTSTSVGKSKSESEAKVSPTGVLTNINKDRARIQVKRRPQTRKARREALRHSTFEEDETDNSSSITTRSIADQTSSSVDPSNVLSPSTDEEDLFGVPPLDLPPDYSKVSTSPGDLFTVPTTVISPGLSLGANDFPVDSNSNENQVVEKAPEKHNKDSNEDIFEDSSNAFHSIVDEGSKVSDDKKVLNSASVNLFDDEEDFPVVKESPRVGIVDDLKQKHSETKSLIQSKPKVEDLDAELFSNKPINRDTLKTSKLNPASDKDTPKTNETKSDPLAISLNLSGPPPLSDEDELFSSSSAAIKGKNLSEKDPEVSSLFSSSSEKKDSFQTKKKTKSLFSNDDDDNDVFFQTSSQVNSSKLANNIKTQPSSDKSKSGSSKMVSKGLFANDDEDDEDLFGGKSKRSFSKQAALTKPPISSSTDKSIGETAAKSKKSIFSDDEDVDIFSIPKVSSSKENQTASKNKSSLNASKTPFDPNSRSSKSVVSKSDSQQPFLDPLSNLEDKQ